MYKKILILLLIALTCLAGLWAGDAASFVDLGFSPDGTVYIFAQYGIQARTLRPWADLYVVDVPNNNFVPGGKISYVHSAPVAAGQDGSGALYRLIARNAALAERHGVDFLFQSQPLYVSLTGEDGGNGQTIEFRDFEAQANYKASLVSTVEGSGASLKSSFYINLERNDGRGTKTYMVGTPQLKRPLVSSYRIIKAMIAPRDGSLIFVIEMHKQGENGADIRYMVEAVRL
jgi:predicted secreted protein